MNTPSKGLAIITVAYHSHKPLSDLANDLNLQTCQPEHWLIVNNSPRSAEPINLDVKCEFSIVNGEEGSGFGQGCNRGLDQLNDQGWTGWVWLLNPDTMFLELDTLEKLQSRLAFFEPKSLVGTGVIGKDGCLECSAGWIDKGLRFRSRRVQENFTMMKSLRVDWLSGCSLLLKPAAHTLKPRFDESLPLYYEDMDLCLRLSRLGSPMFFLSSILIGHSRGEGSHTSPVRRRRLSTCSYVRFLQRHCPLWVQVLRVLRLIGSALLGMPFAPFGSLAAMQGLVDALRRPLK